MTWQDFWGAAGGLLVAIGWFIILFYYVPYTITLAIRRAMGKTPQTTQNNWNLTLHTKKDE